MLQKQWLYVRDKFTNLYALFVENKQKNSLISSRVIGEKGKLDPTVHGNVLERHITYARRLFRFMGHKRT